MSKVKAVICVFIGAVLLSAVGCAKPVVTKYPPSPVYDKPMPPVGARNGTETKERHEAKPKPEVRFDEATKPEPRPDTRAKPQASPPFQDDRLIAAVAPLEKQASGYLAGNDLDRAEATAERALGISPNDAKLWSLMAEIQLARKNWNQAEQFASKSNLLAGSNSALKARNWRTIAEALLKKNKPKEAEKAMEKARGLDSR
jgi:tetratricopeptide (TPR) repeat protein